MSEESQGFDPYAPALADLRAKRDHIDQLIQQLEGVRSGTVAFGAIGIAPSAPVSGTPAMNEAGAFLGMTIPDAARKLLVGRREPLNNADILAGLKKGGLVLNSADPLNTVGSVLTRRFHQVGDIVRIGRGVWGLQEWYPNRSFKKKPGKDEAPPPGLSDDEEQALDDLTIFHPNATARPSEPTPNAPPKSSQPHEPSRPSRRPNILD